AVSWTRLLERGFCYAYGCYEVLVRQRPRSFDVVLGRSHGLGSTLFVPVFQRGVPIVNLCDYFYHAHAHHLTAELGPDAPPEYFHWRRSANAMDMLDLENGIVPWTATAWQRSLYPREYHDDFLVLFDGVEPRRPRAGERRRAVGGRVLEPETRLVTF